MARSVLRATLACAVFGALAAAQQATYATAVEPRTDAALSAQPGGALLSLPGIGTDFVLSGDGQFSERPDGTARLTARVTRASVVNATFVLDLQFAGRMAPGSPGHPPAGSPVLLLVPQAYAPAGPIDPAQFSYYTAAAGSLRGLGAYDGALVDLARSGPAPQLGAGANGRNGAHGLAATFAVQVVQQGATPLNPTADAGLQADLRAVAPMDATHVVADAGVSTLAPARALALPGIGDDYVFVPVAEFTEFGDGHAELRGSLLRVAQLDDRFELALSLTGRVDPGTPGHPPAGSPVLGLLPSAYAGQGGPVDPASWRYYTAASGTLTGRGINDGGVLDLATNGAFQVGVGGNQGNLFFGLHGTCSVQVASQPTARTLQPTGPAELLAVVSPVAVLPRPVLQPLAVPTHPTVTEQPILLQGSNLVWIEQVAIGARIATSRDPRDWYEGWFRIVDDQHLEVHAPPAFVPGSYPMSVLNRESASNQITIDLVPPAAPTLRTENEVREGDANHIVVHKGPLPGPVLGLLAMSPELLPTIVPGIVQLDIGNQFASLLVFPGTFAIDPLTGAQVVVLGPIPPGFAGTTFHLQAALFDLSGPGFPLVATDVWPTSYVP
jgi:hypothetical protein